jgi:methylmalonic aciduria homocystinuria type C protein
VDSALAAAGFDLVHAFDAARVARTPGCELLADPARPRGILVGNTRALWPAFLAARRADPALAAAADPIERYTEQTIERALPAGARVWFGHRRYAGAFLPFQRLAVAAGLGALAPTHLVIHPVYGPWFALRAVVVCAGQPVPRSPVALPCTCGAPCHEAVARAVASHGPDAWRAWLAVRDACPIGRDHRYSEDQIAYHYTKERDLLP